jgi:hypothetical protein
MSRLTSQAAITVAARITPPIELSHRKLSGWRHSLGPRQPTNTNAARQECVRWLAMRPNLLSEVHMYRCAYVLRPTTRTR